MINNVSNNIITAQKTIRSHNNDAIIKESPSVNVPSFLYKWGSELLNHIFNPKLDSRESLVKEKDVVVNCNEYESWRQIK